MAIKESKFFCESSSKDFLSVGLGMVKFPFLGSIQKAVGKYKIILGNFVWDGAIGGTIAKCLG
jgi:hypothetical protein